MQSPGVARMYIYIYTQLNPKFEGNVVPSRECKEITVTPLDPVALCTSFVTASVCANSRQISSAKEAPRLAKELGHLAAMEAAEGQVCRVEVDGAYTPCQNASII